LPQREIPAEYLGPDGFLAGRFISPHSRYTVAVDPGHERLVTDQRGVTFLHREAAPQVAQFEQSGMRDHEIQQALERWTFSGLPEGVNPLTRIGVYDQEANAIAADWTDEQRKAVERKLWFQAEDHPGDLAFVPSPRQPLPWPSYDSDTPDEILEFQKRLKVDPEIVRRYEEENQTRQEIIAAMWELESRLNRGDDAEVASVQA
jgi:hypothetical protein